MSRNVLLFALAGFLSLCSLARGDFKYAQTSQVTGGALAGMVKGLGVFSKSMRQATKPTESTTYVKGDYLRRDNADGTYQIIDLNGRRIIQVSPGARAYSVMTFEQMRQLMEQMQQRMHEGMQKQSQQQNTNVTITPKIEISSTGKTQTILGQDTQEMLMKMDLEMQTTDAQHGTQSGTISTEVDSWVAPSVIGYHEVSDFYKKMAVEIGWTPNTTVGMDARMTHSMVELYKSGKMPVGLPMLTTISMLGAPQSGSQTSSQPQEQPQQSSASATDIGSPGAMAAKALGGMFGRRRKKKQEEENQQNGAATVAPAPANSLMTITSRVSSFSTDSIDDSLFQIPSGFTQVESEMERSLQRSAQ